MQEKYKVAGTIVLYNPDRDVIGNIMSYLEDVNILYVVDNSEKTDKYITDQLLKLRKVRYLPQGENVGIAMALNIAAREAVSAGYDFLLTMDQDSRAEDNMVGTMLSCLNGKDVAGIGIISPFHSVCHGRMPEGDYPCQEVPFAMTSGNLLNLAAYGKVGPFLDKLFIDCVDYDYCLRLVGSGFRIVRANRAILHHKLGNISSYKVLYKTLTTSNHSPLRRYYNTRNRFYIWKTYGAVAEEFVKEDKLKFVWEVRNVLLGEKKRPAKIKMMLRGYLDYRKGRFGKYGR